MEFEFAENYVEEIALEFDTRDVFSIAEKSGVLIIYESWFPVTHGEFDKSKKTIFVNLKSAENAEKIIAHELGHFFAQDLDLGRTEEEIFAQNFADCFAERRNS